LTISNSLLLICIISRLFPSLLNIDPENWKYIESILSLKDKSNGYFSYVISDLALIQLQYFIDLLLYEFSFEDLLGQQCDFLSTNSNSSVKIL